jgi:transposase
MFPRIKKSVKKSGTYEYLVLSESVRDKNGRSTTRDVSTLGNISRFDKSTVSDLIDGLIRLFEIEEYGLTDQVEILQSLEYGSIILWRALWNRLQLNKIVAERVKFSESRISIDVSKYVEMMVINRCVNPLSKLATSRWMETTCYTEMKGYADLPREVEYFYRSMDYLLKAKDEIETKLFDRLRNLFSINVRLTFYDITSTYFHTDSCPLSFNGLSRDNRPDKKQIVIGVVTSYEGYPLKHYVFEGNTKDETTVSEVVRGLKKDFHIEETIFVGDRGMITRLNLDRIEAEEFDYIMGVKHRQDEMMPMLLEDPELFGDRVIECKGLKIANRHICIKDFLIWKMSRILELSSAASHSEAWQDFETFIMRMSSDEPFDKSTARELLKRVECKDPHPYRKISALLRKHYDRCEKTIRMVCALNRERARISDKRRREKISSLSKKLDKILEGSKKDGLELRLEKVFEGYNRGYRRFFQWKRQKSQGVIYGYQLDEEMIESEKKFDGVFMLTTTREDLTPETVVKEYKRLQEVESLFDDLKHFVDIHPVRHWLEHRVRAHVFLCILSLLLKRIFEIDCLGNKAVTESLESAAKSKLVKYEVKMSRKSSASQTFWKATTVTPEQQRWFNLAGIRNPANLEQYLWWRKRKH